MFILEQRWGNDGYSFWFKLLETLGTTEGHYIDCNDPAAWQFLQATTRQDEITTSSILDVLASLNAIDSELWENKIIWSQNFVDGIASVYSNRRVEKPSRPDNYKKKPEDNGNTTRRNPQSIVEYNKVKETIVEIIDHLNDVSSSNYKATTKDTVKHINARLKEGFTVDDFKLVNSYKTKEWKDDAEYSKYLRPATLYNSEKFEGYLNDARRNNGIPKNKQTTPKPLPGCERRFGSNHD